MSIWRVALCEFSSLKIQICLSVWIFRYNKNVRMDKINKNSCIRNVVQTVLSILLRNCYTIECSTIRRSFRSLTKPRENSFTMRKHNNFTSRLDKVAVNVDTQVLFFHSHSRKLRFKLIPVSFIVCCRVHAQRDTIVNCTFVSLQPYFPCIFFGSRILLHWCSCFSFSVNGVCLRHC